MIRVEIDAMPALLHSIVRAALEGHGDLVIAPESSGPDHNKPAADTDVLIVCSDREPFNHLLIHGLLGHRAPAVVAIDTDGECASIVHLFAEHQRLDAASDLGQLVRRAFQTREATH